MSIHARLRLLLALTIIAVGGSVWIITGQQRDAVIGMQGELRVSNDLLRAMLDQETGLRGYALTGEQEFLEPYRRGQIEYQAALRNAQTHREAATEGVIRELAVAASRWQANAGAAVDLVDRRGPRAAFSIDGAHERKVLMDRIRSAGASLRAHVEEHTQERLQHSRWVSLIFVLLFSTTVFSLGMVALERQAGRERARGKQRREYVEALQGADDEGEAKELVRRRAERVAPGTNAVVLTRNASGNSLAASTDPSGIPGLAEALADANPRSCLAIRRAGTHERTPGGAPLQTCELCHRADGAALCVPSLIGGEVIGSLLVVKDRAIKPDQRDRVVAAVSQAAPVLANLRNLAIAEHRAATDPLTRLPNARSVQEALIRMVAQSTRTGAPLSALVLDLDHFKALNDRHGHQAGDEVLERLGTVLRHGVRASDFAGRWGGEEFVILLPDTDHEGALQAAETMRASVEGLEVPGVIAHITASLGVATLPDHALDGPSLIRAADRALYRAKAAGRNCVVAAVAVEAPAG